MCAVHELDQLLREWNYRSGSAPILAAINSLNVSLSLFTFTSHFYTWVGSSERDGKRALPFRVIPQKRVAKSNFLKGIHIRIYWIESNLSFHIVLCFAFDFSYNCKATEIALYVSLPVITTTPAAQTVWQTCQPELGWLLYFIDFGAHSVSVCKPMTWNRRKKK